MQNKIVTAFSSGLRAFSVAFREQYLGTVEPANYTSFSARVLRYKILASMYENSTYRNIHNWARNYKETYGLYRHVRNIYSPAYRIGEFWKSHLLAGALDPLAGDGVAVPSALPIITKNEALRLPISTLWTDSNFQVRKDILSLKGSTLGDIAIKVEDDPIRGKVYLDILDPSKLSNIEFDIFGNVKSYSITELKEDPLNPARTVTYAEICSRNGLEVVYQTYRDGAPYAWNGVSSEWSEPYGFVPVVFLKHNDVGLDYGWSEFFPGLSKIREVDDLGSKLSDQIRKMVDAPILFSGVKAQTVTVPKEPETGNTKSEAERERVPAIYSSD